MFDPEDGLKFAMKIRGDRKMHDEAGIRAAVSRCYYSSLLAVKPYLGHHKTLNTDNLHNIAISHVQKVNRTLGDLLRYLHYQHVKADLCDDDSWNEDAIVNAHSAARQFIDDIKRVRFTSDGPPPSP